MLKKYSKVAPVAESKIGPSIETLKFIINYSRAIEAKKNRKAESAVPT